ncbi:MAG TPA: CaiB/BaiF CoA-transferase family protein [Acidimicrobiales bacterium]|nr:CaiB/BaiF CoA-transferase family protein [Acidimicrobiales bacterium]
MASPGEQPSAGPLADVAVLDLTVARAGPTCVRQLADWGAQVTRVEPPPALGDRTGTGERRHGSDFQNLHRNKASLTLDLSTPAGREVLGRLAKRADVVVENMRPAVKHRLGVDYETLRAANPGLVYGSISGFGQDGPYADRAGVDQIAQGMGGLMSVTGAPGEGPMRAGIPVADLAAGLYLAVGILAALHRRAATGEGGWVTTSLLEAMVAMMDFQATRWTVDGEVPGQAGNHHPTLLPTGCFPTADGWVNVAGSGGRLLARLCEAIGLPDLPTDPRFDTTEGRSAHREELNGLITERLATRTTSEWVATLNQAGVPCGPVYGMDQVFADPQVAHLGLVAPVAHPDLGTLDLVRNPVRLAGTGWPAMRAATPEPGADTEAVLAEAGLDPEEIEALRHQGVV